MEENLRSTQADHSTRHRHQEAVEPHRIREGDRRLRSRNHRYSSRETSWRLATRLANPARSWFPNPTLQAPHALTSLHSAGFL